MTTTLPPIARPVVEVLSERPGRRDAMHSVVCDHCPWTYGPTASKADAGRHASRHRAEHRAGVVRA